MRRHHRSPGPSTLRAPASREGPAVDLVAPSDHLARTALTASGTATSALLKKTSPRSLARSEQRVSLSAPWSPR